MTTSQYKIVVEIVIEVVDDMEDPKQIAEHYAKMATKYKSVGAVESNVVKVERTL